MVAPKDSHVHLYSLGGTWKMPVYLDFVKVTCIANESVTISEQYFRYGAYVSDDWMQSYSLAILSYTKGNKYTLIFEGKGMLNRTLFDIQTTFTAF